MKYYLDITLLPGADIAQHVLWSKVYQQIHLGLAEMQSDSKTPIGVSFPGYNTEKHQLGSKLRLLAADATILESFDANRWLNRLSDYVHITSIREVPDKITRYVCFYRVQTKSNNARLARRKARREGIPEDQAFAALKHRKEKLTDAPYLHIKSLSNGEKFRLFIGCDEQETASAGNGFSSYGLSRQSSVPVF